MPEKANSPSEPRLAATVILLRKGGTHNARGLEVCLAKRNPEARFMPGVWVFPGGAVDEADGTEDAGLLACAVREVAEEVGVEVDTADLTPYSRWITPEVGRIRFDTFFYLAQAPAHTKLTPDGSETVDAGWFAPADALSSHAEDRLPLVFPTIKHLESLLPYSSAEEALAGSADREIEPVLPRVEGDGEERKIVLPDGWGEATPLPRELQ